MGMRAELLNAGPGQRGRPLATVAVVSFVAGGLLLVGSAYVHFHLWRTGYRHIPTIGPLFLLQSVAGLCLGVLVVAVRRAWAAALGAGFALSTIAGFLVSVEHGLFGFKDSWSAPDASLALALEIAAVVVLAGGAGLCLAGRPALLRHDDREVTEALAR
jgi:hypothetical protein